MKKLAFSIFAAALTFGANADVEPAGTSACCAYDGLFFGLGVSAVDAGVKTETTAEKGVIDDYDESAARTKIIENKLYGTSSTSGFEGDLGIDTNDHDTRFTGNVTIGYGKRIKEKAYIALEAGLDLGQSSNFCHVGISPDSGKKYDVFSKNMGFIPSVGLRLGYVHPESKNMFYIKAGAAYSQAKTTYVDNYLAGYENSTPPADKSDDLVYDTLTYSGKCSKWTPIVALGFEKVTGKNFRTRAEVEYRFQTTKSFDFSNDNEFATPVAGSDDDHVYSIGDPAGEYSGTVKIYNKAAITLRVMGIYTVK